MCTIMFNRLSVRLALLAGLLLCAPAAGAQDHDPQPAPEQQDDSAETPPAEGQTTEEETPQFEDQVEVRARADDLVGIASSANEGATGHEDLERRPLLRPAELVETVPGVIATQHSGDGKANQYYLHGFTSTTAPTSPPSSPACR